MSLFDVNFMLKGAISKVSTIYIKLNRYQNNIESSTVPNESRLRIFYISKTL